MQMRKNSFLVTVVPKIGYKVQRLWSQWELLIVLYRFGSQGKHVFVFLLMMMILVVVLAYYILSRYNLIEGAS